MDEFKKYERISFLFFLNTCIWPFSPEFFINSVFFVLDSIVTVIGIIIFTIKAIFNLNISKLKKVLLVVAQLIAYFILEVIWLFICVFIIGDGINFY